MQALNVEIKARCENPDRIRAILDARKARFVGTDHQIDTYFKANHGRMKLREGNIENALIHYLRPDQEGPKRSEVILYKTKPDSSLKALLSEGVGVLTVVDKLRSIYFIENVKFHLDEVKNLGSFVEIEAIDKDGTIGEANLLEQCTFYLKLFEIDHIDLLDKSYSDMILGAKQAF